MQSPARVGKSCASTWIDAVPAHNRASTPYTWLPFAGEAVAVTTSPERNPDEDDTATLTGMFGVVNGPVGAGAGVGAGAATAVVLDVATDESLDAFLVDVPASRTTA